MIYLFEAMHDRKNLLFQDFKFVNEYNSEVRKIQSLLKFCKEDLTETYLLEKTFSTFHASNMLLQQQYRERKFTKFSELITILFTEANAVSWLKDYQQFLYTLLKAFFIKLRKVQNRRTFSSCVSVFY